MVEKDMIKAQIMKTKLTNYVKKLGWISLHDSSNVVNVGLDVSMKLPRTVLG
jgi:hypothetical protein